MNKRTNRASGFTLVEIAIVVVIIGLIVGGVIGGSSLIASANKQVVIKEMNQVVLAARNFQLDYGKLPGLLRNPSDNYDTTNCSTLDDEEDRNLSVLSGTTGQAAFSQLYCTGYLTGYSNSEMYSGYKRSKFKPEHGTLAGYSYTAGTYWIFALNKNRERSAIMLTPSRGQISSNVISPKEASWIDKKIDDGKPKTGNLLQITSNSGSADCYTDSTNKYNVAVKASECNFDYIID